MLQVGRWLRPLFGIGPMRRRQVLGLAGTALVLSPSLVHAQSLPRLRTCDLQRQDGGLRLRLALGTQVAYRSFSLSNPARLVVDLSGISTQAPQMDPVPEGSAVTAIRSGPHGDGLRVVLDLAQPLTATARWEDSVLVFDLVAAPGAASLPAADPAAATAAVTRSRLHPYVIAIDAGHGGKDPGAVSADCGCPAIRCCRRCWPTCR